MENGTPNVGSPASEGAGPKCVPLTPETSKPEEEVLTGMLLTKDRTQKLGQILDNMPHGWAKQILTIFQGIESANWKRVP